MILAPIADRSLRAAVRRAALPEEDVLHSAEDVVDALRFGFPRLLVYSPGDGAWWPELAAPGHPPIPTLVVTSPTLESWEVAWQSGGLAVRRVDDSALRLRSLMGLTTGRGWWVEKFFDDMVRVVGRGLPSGVRGLARRVMESPTRYIYLDDLGWVTGLTPGALKERFRRRGLPSPARYLRWFRLIAAANILRDPEVKTLEASHRLGFSSDGNFCRWVRTTSGLSASALRRPAGRTVLQVRLAESCFPEGSLEKWSSLEPLFLRAVA